MSSQGNGLMYIDIIINGKPIRAMVDKGVIHNYLANSEVDRLGLVVEYGACRVKAINSATQSIADIARYVIVKVGPYLGKTNFFVVQMDNFKMIIGLEFLRET